ncbi:DegV family protein with EDD domain [Desulfitispora alkaliphila]|uniref:DegV family protein n=1 Tax=Desulfitispora alkaliphila TaxID=622674 RepID=UPI003D2476A2
MSVKVITDSTSYIPKQIREKLSITVISLSINFETETFLEEELDNHVFYEKMDQSADVPTSSQPSLNDFCKHFEQQVNSGNAVVGVFLSADMSGTFSTAQSAKKLVLEKYPEAEIELVDSRSNCMELGFATIVAAKAAKAGESVAEVAASAHHVISRSRFLFTPDTLSYLKKGGRIGGAAALVGTVLQIKPILTVVDGKTSVFTKVRTKKKAIETIVNAFLEDVSNKGLGDATVHHINNEAEGREVAELIKEKTGKTISLTSIGPVIGLHVGPGAIGIAYYTEE